MAQTAVERMPHPSMTCSAFLLAFLLVPRLALGTPALAQPLTGDCLDVHCLALGDQTDQLGLLEHENRQEELLEVDGKPLEKCRTCHDCTRSGYSVCVQPRHYDQQRQYLMTTAENGCECAHSGPIVVQPGLTARNATDHHHHPKLPKCKLVSANSATPTVRIQQIAEPILDEGEGLFRVCYASALRKLPTPKASNDNDADGQHPVLVTVNQFWQADYWHSLRPRQLQLFYVFPVTQKEHCEGQILVPSAQDMMWINAGKSRDQVTNSRMIWLCKASLDIAMNGLEQEEGQENSNTLDDEIYDDGADPELPPEVQFERDVFAGAKRVRFYYELKVHRDNLLKSVAGKVRFENRETLIKSDTLDFELHPEIYGTGSHSRSSSHQPSIARNGSSSRIDRVNIEQRPSEKPNDGTPREPIIRPAHSRRPGGKSDERSRTTTGTSQSFSPSHSTAGARPIQSRPISDPAHAIEPSTAVPIPTSAEEDDLLQPTPAEEEEENEDDYDGTSHTPSGKTKVREPDEEDWLLLRNVLIISLLLLALFVVVAICYKRGVCCFPNRSSSSGSQQRNGKTRVQNGKEYREAGR